MIYNVPGKFSLRVMVANSRCLRMDRMDVVRRNERNIKGY